MKIKLLIIMLFISILATSCSNHSYEKYTKEGFALGTFITVSVYSKQKVSDDVLDAVFNKLNEIEMKMTINTQVSSEIEEINKAAGKDFVKVSDETFYVIKTAIDYTKKTSGRFDLTVGALVKLWNIGFDNARIPEDSEIQKALTEIGVNDIILNEEDKSVKLKREGMIIDLGGIAKGYSADAVEQLLLGMGYDKALINLGGNVLCIGTKPDGSSFVIGIRDPFGSAVSYVGTVSINDSSVVTSGIYERFFEQNGEIYHHILDTSTGYPVDNNFESVSILTKKSIQADALSTGVFSMGLQEGYNFISGLDGVDAIFITKDKKIYLTEGAKSLFELTNSEYKIVDMD